MNVSVAVISLAGALLSHERVESLLVEAVEGNDYIREAVIDGELLRSCVSRHTIRYAEVGSILRSAYWSLLTDVDGGRMSYGDYMRTALPIFHHFSVGPARLFTHEDAVFLKFLCETYPLPDMPRVC